MTLLDLVFSGSLEKAPQGLCSGQVLPENSPNSRKFVLRDLIQASEEVLNMTALIEKAEIGETDKIHPMLQIL